MPAKIEMESRKADVAPAAALIVGTMPGAVSPLAGGAMTSVMSVAAPSAVAGSVSVTRVVMTGVASLVAGAMSASMAGTVRMMMVTRLHCGGGKDSKAGSDGQKSDKLFHDAWGLGLIRCRKRAACKSDAVPMRLFNITSVFYEHQRQSPHRF
ncbi:MAG TPA: hypothetical protein P5016_02365 [Verrucomicrobiales bacterium]|nr:hypothetical protein [Verrucomicrobiales bacterium]